MHKLFWFLIVLLPLGLKAQSSHFPKGHQVYHTWDRIQNVNTKYNNLHSSIKHFYRKQTIDILNDSIHSHLSNSDLKTINYLHRDNIDFSKRGAKDSNKKSTGVFRHFYKDPANFIKLEKPNLSLLINPILNLRMGRESSEDELIFQNTRGVELRGMIDDRIYFYSSVFENQARFVNFIERRIEERKAIPGQGFYKIYQSNIFDAISGYDYLNADAYFGIPASQSLTIELGHSSHFIGNGYRSLLLSDFANNYFFLKLNLNVWKFHYQSIFAELASISSILNPNDQLLSKKYMATHYLSFKSSNKFEIGLFESVIFSRENNFEFQYLNPVILYRTVEQLIDSPDNVLIGLNGRWDPVKNISLFGQLIVDEFRLSELTAGNGWWANKYGFQTGIKYFNAIGIDNFDLHAEMNLVRPFTYGHRDQLEAFPNISIANYSHYGQELAHPLGSNFYEFIFQLRYQIENKWFFMAKTLYAVKGENPEGSNIGSDITIPSETRMQDFGFGLTDGISRSVYTLSFDFSYHFFHNYYLDFNYLYRKDDSDNNVQDLNTNFVGLGLRVNVSNYKIDY